jgi:hypothetical protein
VDDALLFYKNKQFIHTLTDKLKLEGMLFREEESVAGYLGVHIDRRDDGTIHLTQKGLADKIVDSLYLSGDDVARVDTPCTKYVPIDEDGELAHGKVSLIATFSERVAEVCDSPNSLNSFKILSYHHDNGNVLNQSSMDIDLFRTNLSDKT